jgi:hypothetical protein
MDGTFSFLFQMLPPLPVIIIGIAIIRHDVAKVEEGLKDMKKSCDSRFKWCLDHFEEKHLE